MAVCKGCGAEIKSETQYQKRIRNGLTLFSRERSTVCICPLCGNKHKFRMNWRGRGIPRKYCPHCLNLSVLHAPLEEHRIFIKESNNRDELIKAQEKLAEYEISYMSEKLDAWEENAADIVDNQ